jgi:hypothetical protein
MVAATVVWVSPVLSVMAAEEQVAAPKKERERPALTEMTVTGTISKEEMKGRQGRTMTHYVLTDAAGSKIFLPMERRHRGGEGAEQPAQVNLEEYVGKNVTIVGKGFTTEREGKKFTRIVEISKIEAAAAAPAAPAPEAPAAQ